MPTDPPGVAEAAALGLIDDDLLELTGRALRTQNALIAACGSDTPRRHVSIFAQAIDSQHSDGSWGSDDYPSMKPCFTAQTIDMLWHLEKSQRTDEPLLLPTLMSIDQIQRAVAWLRASQRADGSWGEDAWDTCQVLKALALAGLSATDLNVRRQIEWRITLAYASALLVTARVGSHLI